MKRKYLSALLMGTLTVASMSTFTSCKDYDDDISNLQGQIDKLATADQLSQKVAELQALISSNKSDITSLQAELAKKTTLDEVKAVLADYATKQYVDAADKTLQDAIDALKTGDIAKLKEDVVKAQAAADKAAKDAEAANAEIIETLKTLATKTELKDAADAAQKAIEALESKNAEDLKKAQDAITETLKSYATKSDVEDGDKKTLESLASTIKNASDALAQANTNKQAIDDALDILGKGYSKENTVAAAIEAIKGQIGTPNKELGTLDSRLGAIESVLNGVKDDDTKLGLATKVTNIETQLKDIIGQYSTMVTDVQLYKFAQTNVDGFDNNSLNFVQTAEHENVFPVDAKATDKQLTFKDGKYYVGEDSLLVRVSPVDAELTASNVSLMNSQGVELDDIIDVTNVHRYNGLISRAAANTGLWVVKFKAKDLGDKFKEVAETKVNGDKKHILYSVAVKNTYNTTGKKEDANTRRVTSEFGVALTTTDAEPAWDFSVNGKNVAEIHNRYVQCEDGTSTKQVQELVWKKASKPATTVITEGNKANALNRPYLNNDDRHKPDILAVEKGQPITIDFASIANKGVKGFYVTLDEKFALESAPSELNAWNSYEYENVGYNGKPAKLFEGSKGTITIKNMNNVEGDIIGFRVYAVNYDGTLTDPDGRSFYVAVGEVKQGLELGNSKLTLNAYNKFESTVELPADFSKYDFTANTAWEVTEEDADGKKPTSFTVEYFNADHKKVNSLTKDVKYIKFILNTATDFIDDATYNVTTTLTKKISSATAEVCKVTASFTKVMPSEAPMFGYRDGFSKNPEYIIPHNKSYEVESLVNKGGYFDFRNILIINNNTTWHGWDLMHPTTDGLFTFNVADGTYRLKNGKYILNDAATSSTEYLLYVDNSGEKNLVDNTTERTVTAKFIYRNISKRYDADRKAYYDKGDFTVPSMSTEKIVYCSWIKTFSYDITSTKKKDTDVEGNTWLKSNTVTWKKTGSTNTATLDLNNLATEIKDVKLLPVGFPEGVSKTKFGEFLTNNVLAVVPGQYGDIYTTDNNDKQINPYFSATIANGKITLKQKSQDAIPSSVTGGNIHFTVKDCFGNTMNIVLPFSIEVKGIAAKKH